MFLVFVVAVREGIACNMAYSISTMNSYSPTVMVTFSMTPVDLNKAAKKC
jgi:hypothetical protein